MPSCGIPMSPPGSCSLGQRGSRSRADALRLESNRNSALDTIMHEVAHVLAGPGVGQGPTWKRVATQVGASPERCCSLDAPPQRITGTCVCGPIYGRTRSRRSGARHGCRICRTEIKWTLRDIQERCSTPDRRKEIRLAGDEHLKGRRGVDDGITGAVAVSPHGLQIVSWAESGELVADTQQLMVGLGPRPATLAHAPATGQALASNGQLGVDLIRLEAGKGFQPHTHPGDHVLIVVGGEGTITYDGVVYPTRSGDLCMIDGHVPHAVGARTDHVILAVGSPHRPVDAIDRMEPVEYREVLSDFGDLRCLTCGIESAFPRMLHDVACPHCPCSECTMDKTHHQTL